VGVIPESWQEFQLVDVADVDPDALGSNTPADFTFNYISLENCDGGRLLGFTEQRFCDAPSRARRVVRTGDFLYATVRPGLRGHCAFRGGLGEWVASTGFAVIRAKKGVSESGFLSQVLMSNSIQSQVDLLLAGSNYPAINSRDVKALKVLLPPVDEQKEITEALSDADALVESLDALIAKKRDMKQAAMQLLFSQELMSGSSSEVVRFDRDVSMKARIGWQGLTTAEYRPNGEFRLVTGTDLQGGSIDWSRCWYVDENRFRQDPNIQLAVGDVLVTKDGTIGKVGFVEDLPQPATLNSGVFVLRPVTDKIRPEYLRYLLCSSIFRDFLDRLAAGSTITHLYQKDFVDFCVQVPDEDSQVSAINLLTAMDRELSALAAQREKADLVKRGMMQELLSGRVRLV
jgi:type I restriction enzyme S subunit